MSEVEDLDAVVIGGGINGCGTFRDLCLQGVRTLLLERDDFCSGASAASSRLMHGGLKYLETGEFRLVREALVERNMLLATAPHYVQPLECVLPVRSALGGISGSAQRFLGRNAPLTDRGFVITALGLTLYDLYGRALRAMPGHRMVRRRALRRMLPDLAPAITGAGIYYEAHITHAERLGLELVLDGEAACTGARAENHAELLGRDGDILRYRSGGAERRVRVRSIVNAGGAWIDRVNADLGCPSHLMGGRRGAHLVVRNPALLAALGGRMVYFGTPDGRVNLLYPFAGLVLVGATDIAHADPDTAACDADEAAYLCRAVAEVFPGMAIAPGQVVARFSGVRPLPRSDGPGAVTRDHLIVTVAAPGGPPVHCLIGGKWTTFRAFSEVAADRVLADLGRTRSCSTAGLPIGGGRGYPRDPVSRQTMLAELGRAAGITPARAGVLLSRYGTRARDYCDRLQGRGETMMASLPDHACEEIVHIAATERATTPEDILRRRTLIALTGQDRPAVRAEVAGLMATVRSTRGPAMGREIRA